MKGFFSVTVLFIAFAIVVRSTPLAHRSNEQECGEALTTCVAPAIERYAGKNEAEVFEEVRDTPIRTHCSDWNTAIGCVRQVVYSDVCDDVRPNIDHLDELLELYDWFSNYICVEHVDKVDRNFRCLVSLELFSEFATTCKDEIGENNLCVINENKERIAQCAYGVITGRCGAEATSVVRGTSEKIFEYLEMGAKDYCETSKRARQLAVLKSILRRL